ncbi:hypothetical protein UFOVP514_29 [uncultured Caudovirales phage]|uniref:DUF6291 domain-containing protein n=1 Tax=uncultured Caudovirales phage TaxID=2100421 RepID=A0A6J5MP48_9CAUD|nr:hypothetical protein UFOVP514_29 [uncultured Caudovirales phage]
MALGKKKVIVYTDWITQFKDLTDEEAGKLIKHFFEYVNDLNPKSDRLIELLFNPIKATLKRDLGAWESKQQTNKENGLKGGRPKKEITQNNPNNPNGLLITQNNPQKGVSDSVSVSVSVNVKKEVLSVRKVNFSESLKPFLEKYSKDMLNNFYLYWTEHGEKDIKMRYEKERTFGLSQRLATWYKNDYSPKAQTKIDNPYNLSPAQLESNRIAKLQLDEAIRLKNLSNDSK